MPDISTHRIYLAAPLFNEIERAFNRSVRDQLEKWSTVFLPQEDGALMTDLLSANVPYLEARKKVFSADVDAIRKCNIVLAVLDGRTIDEGVAFELGFAFALGKECWGLKTDDRSLLETGDNPMILGALTCLFRSPQEIESHAARVGWSSP